MSGSTLVLTSTHLAEYGLLPTAGAAVQIDITAVLRQHGDALVETYLCDHNCTITHEGKQTGGHYNCPAALTLNRGAVASTIASADRLLHGIEQTLSAARQTQSTFAETEFDDYADVFRLPAAVRRELRAALLAGPSEVTLFGGSPEAHSEIVPLINGLKKRGHTVHLTMTGRRIIRNPEVLNELVDSGVDVLALSADDVSSVVELTRMLEADPEQLRVEWRKVPVLHGQRQKVFEAIHVARLWQRLPADDRPGILFNIAVHSGNVRQIDEMLTTLSAAFPGARLNPFPMQSAFEDRVENVGPQLNDVRVFITRALSEQHLRAAGETGAWSMVPRMHYWLLLAAAMDDVSAGARIAGWNTWKCFRSSGSGRYVQVAGTGRRVSSLQPAGGRVGCFWNDSINDEQLPAIWDASQQELRTYLELRPVRAAQLTSACAGCLFPRLVGDMVSLETGLDPDLREQYLELRRQHLGF